MSSKEPESENGARRTLLCGQGLGPNSVCYNPTIPVTLSRAAYSCGAAPPEAGAGFSFSAANVPAAPLASLSFNSA